MHFKIEGLDDLTRQLDDLAKRAEQLHGTHDVPLPELLTPRFLAACSEFASVEELFQASGFQVESPEDFKAIPEAEWDAFIKKSTSFGTWEQMLEAASATWTTQQLGLE